MREKLRHFILDKYDIDIDSKGFKYNSNAYSYVLNNGEVTLKVTGLGKKRFTREEKMAQVMWSEDLALFKGTVCEPLTSKKGSRIETVTLGNWDISISAYKTPRGQLPDISKIRPLFFVVLGDLMGGIHNTSMEQTDFGMHYKLPSIISIIEGLFSEHRGKMAIDVQNHIADIISSVKLYEQTPENYGMCYGGFNLGNVLLDVNNPYIYDFDNSSYGFFLYDVATFVWDLIMEGYMPEVPSEKLVFSHFLPWFSVGYRMNKQSDESTFKDIGLFLKYHTVRKYIDYLTLETSEDESAGIRNEKLKVLPLMLCSADFYKACDEYRKKYNI